MCWNFCREKNMPDFKSTSVKRPATGKINSSLKVKKKGTGNETGLTGYSADSPHSSEIQTNGKSLFCMTQPFDEIFVRKFQVFPHIFHLASRTCFYCRVNYCCLVVVSLSILFCLLKIISFCRLRFDSNFSVGAFWICKILSLKGYLDKLKILFKEIWLFKRTLS